MFIPYLLHNEGMENDICWQPPSTLALAPGEVHIWLASLEQPPECVQQFLDTLAPDERARAARFYFEKDRRHFIVARGILRALLSSYVQVPATSLRFAYNAYGKPALEFPATSPALCFNLAHSHEMALYAFVYKRELGVDIEYMRLLAADEYISLAQHHFSPSEYATLRALPESVQKQAFFNCWTRKEAYIKARGKGLSIPLDSFDVSLAPDKPAELLASREAPHTVNAWSLHTLTMPSDYAAALMTAGREWRCCYRQWGNC